MKTKPVVTRESLQAMLDKGERYTIDVIGRALSRILERQTESEAVSATTHEANNVGFTHADAYSGTLTAKSYQKHGTLADWQVQRWLKKGKSGFARLTKYHKQLNQIAVEAAVKKAPRAFDELELSGLAT